jgi:Domain of unknown function (DUF5916)
VGLLPLLAFLLLVCPAVLGAAQVVPAGVPLQGPPPPDPPAVIAHDDEGRVTIRAVAIDEPLHIDGRLDEAIYRRVPAITEFVQIEPDAGQPVSEPTAVWVLFDREHLYISARCSDRHPDRIVANDMRRDGSNITQNDNMSIVLDTFYDRRNGYEFLVTPVGGMMDNQITDERDVNRDWNTVWVARSRLDEHGWTFEAMFPFRSLRYRAPGPQVWGINIRRTIRWKNEYAYVSPVPRSEGARGILRFSMAATLVGHEIGGATLGLDVKPYAAAAARADRAVDPTFATEIDGDAGFDVKYVLARSLTADLTYHTDFAQVEDDDQQVNLTRFSLLYPEKREFFLEGQGIFAFGGVESSPRRAATAPTNTPVLFFSRRIGIEGDRAVPIDVGGRLTGKAGPYSVGVLQIRTSESDVAGAPATDFSVARVKRDVLGRSYVGAIGTRRGPSQTGASHNLAFGVDTGLNFYKFLSIIGYYARTRTPGREGEDHSYRGRLAYDADLFGLTLEHLAVGRNFEPEIGFLRRRNFVESLAQLRVSQRPNRFPRIRKLSYHAGFDYVTDTDGRVENRQARAALQTDLQNSDSWLVEYLYDYDFVPEPFTVIGDISIPVGAYRFSTFTGRYTLGAQHRVAGDVTLVQGGFYGGTRTEAGYRGRIEISPQLSIEPGITIYRLDLPQGRETAPLLSARGTFSVNPSLWVAALLQYNGTSNLATANIRLRWEYRPGSDLFLVYSDGRNTRMAGPDQLLSRGFTAKITRLLRF